MTKRKLDDQHWPESSGQKHHAPGIDLKSLTEWLERHSLVKYARGQTRSEAKAPPNRSNQKAPHEAAHVACRRMRRRKLPPQRNLLPTEAPVPLAYRKHACPEANANKPRGDEASSGYPENGIHEGVHLSSNEVVEKPRAILLQCTAPNKRARHGMLVNEISHA